MDGGEVDIDGDGRVDSFEPVACFMFDDADALEFDDVGGDDLMTRTVSTSCMHIERSTFLPLVDT